MKYIFVMNPAAGKNQATLNMIPDLQKTCEKHGFEYQIYISKSGEDIIDFVKSATDDGEEYRVYAFGGDGTLNKVVNGAIGNEKVSVGVFPMGTGNDFIKSFRPIQPKDFLDIEKQLFGDAITVDVIGFDDNYAINTCNTGLDANIAVEMPRFKRLPLVSNKTAYSMSIAKNVFGKLSRPMEIITDGQVLFSGEVVMCVIGNGKFCGSAYKLTPLAEYDDGLIDVNVVINPPSKIALPKFISAFTKGTHLEQEGIKEYIRYARCKSVTVNCPKEYMSVNDGEPDRIISRTYNVIEQAVRFIVPKADEIKE